MNLKRVKDLFEQVAVSQQKTENAKLTFVCYGTLGELAKMLKMEEKKEFEAIDTLFIEAGDWIHTDPESDLTRWSFSKLTGVEKQKIEEPFIKFNNSFYTAIEEIKKTYKVKSDRKDQLFFEKKYDPRVYFQIKTYAI